MLPAQLVAANFSAYPPEARRIAGARVPLLRRLPLGFLPLLLRELIIYDWKFPAERRELDRQFAYLTALSREQLAQAMTPFARLQLAPTLEKTDWVNSPAGFSEQLTAHLWATHQIDAFRTAAVDYVNRSSAVMPDEPLAVNRLGIAVIGQGVSNNSYPLFRKLKKQGTHFTRVKGGDVRLVMELIGKRASAHPVPYGHWYIDGGPLASTVPENVTRVSYFALAPARAALHSRMQRLYEAPQFDPEAFRTLMARIGPEEIGLQAGKSPLLDRFQLSLLTEGSGTQVFATTFVQWAAREALRRAQPLTLIVRFAPRQRENSMAELLAESKRPPELDPQGSLVDADMGAYYTWLNQQRLAEAEKASFLVWLENQSEAVAIGPRFEKDRTMEAPFEFARLLEQSG